MTEIKSKSGRGGKRKGSGRKALPDDLKKVVYNVRMIRSAITELQARAKMIGVTPGEFIADMLS